MSIHPDTTVGRVSLTVRDIARLRGFYESVVGLTALSAADGRVTLGVAGAPLVELVADPEAASPPRHTTGLYHLAILLPSRLELARALRRLIGARWRLVGAADHLVSEALYLDDPEGNGIEIYRDRPREEWRRDGAEIAMATLPLDLDDLMAELAAYPDDASEPMPRDATMGHVHLHVADLPAAEAFYGDLLGFDVTARGYPGALFMSAGGYHHHLGLNTWAGEGAPPPPGGSTGLRHFEIVLAGASELELLLGRVREKGVPVREGGGAGLVRDPSKNALLLRAGSR